MKANSKSRSAARWHMGAAEWIALVALLTSLVSGLYNVWGWLIGNDIRLYVPEQIDIRTVRKGDNDAYLGVIARFTYANYGRENYQAALLAHTIELPLDDSDSLLYTDQYLVRTLENNHDGWLPIQGNSTPFALKGGNSWSQEVWLIPKPVTCAPDCKEQDQRIYWVDLENWLSNTKKTDLILTMKGWLAQAPNAFVEVHCHLQVEELRRNLRLTKSTRLWGNCRNPNQESFRTSFRWF